MKQYNNYSHSKYKEVKFYVDSFWFTPDHHISCVFKKEIIIDHMKCFVSSKNRPTSCAYLMPIKCRGETQGILFTKKQVIDSKLLEYSNWINDDQKSFYYTKVVMYNRLQPKTMDLKDI